MNTKNFRVLKLMSLVLSLSMITETHFLWAATSNLAATTKPPVPASVSANSPTGNPNTNTSTTKPAVPANSMVPAGPLSAPKVRAYASPLKAIQGAVTEQKNPVLRFVKVYDIQESGEGVNPIQRALVGVKQAPADGKTPEEYFWYEVVKRSDGYVAKQSRRATDQESFQVEISKKRGVAFQEVKILSMTSAGVSPDGNGKRFNMEVSINGKKYKAIGEIQNNRYLIKSFTEIRSSSQGNAQGNAGGQNGSNGTNNTSSGNNSNTGNGGTKATSAAKVEGTAVVGGMYPGPTSYSLTVSGASQDHPVKVTVKTRQPGASTFTEEIVTVTQDGAKLSFSEPVRHGLGEGEAKGQLILIFTQDGQDIRPDIKFYYAP